MPLNDLINQGVIQNQGLRSSMKRAQGYKKGRHGAFAGRIKPKIVEIQEGFKKKGNQGKLE